MRYKFVISTEARIQYFQGFCGLPLSRSDRKGGFKNLLFILDSIPPWWYADIHS